MKVTIDSDVILKHRLTVSRFMTIMAICAGSNLVQEVEALEAEGVIHKNPNGKYSIEHTLKDSIDSILLESKTSIPKANELKKFAERIRSMVPQGRKGDSPYFYKCNNNEVILSLQRFYQDYGNYSQHDIETAIRQYVESFNGDYTYMQLLKNFIYKVESDGGFSSGLASYLENSQDG